MKVAAATSETSARTIKREKHGLDNESLLLLLPPPGCSPTHTCALMVTWLRLSAPVGSFIIHPAAEAAVLAAEDVLIGRRH